MTTRKFCEIQHRVPFHDLDPMQIVWHGNYLRYFDMARFALFRENGIDLYELYQQTRYLFPITRTATKYIVPLQHNDPFVCRATVMEAQIKIVLQFEIRHADTGIVCTTGRSDQVAVKMPENEMMFEIPAMVQEALLGTN